jgi:pimeloyl-ACP methyl ester carboxylesterase
MAQQPKISVPTILIQGTEDGATLPETTAGKERFFTGRYDYRLVEAGHFIQREDPQSVIRAALELLSGTPD